MKRYSHLISLYFIIIMYLELWHRSFIYGSIWNFNLIYTSVFSLIWATIFTFLSSLGKPKTNKIMIGIFLVILSIVFSGNFIYMKLFSVPFTIRVTTLASQAFEFLNIFFLVLKQNIAALLILWLPFIYYLLRIRKMNFEKTYYYEKKKILVIFGISILCSLLILFPFKNQEKSAYRLYWKEDDLMNSIRTFGLLTSEIKDINRAIFGFEEELNFNKRGDSKPKEITYNELDIDFESLTEAEKEPINRSLYEYFNNEIATNKNEYTGLYTGKNLIFILAESFNSLAVSEQLTPTLYKLTNSGFHFSNFYSPVFLSTTGGEFQAMTGLIPTMETLNEWYKGKVSLPFSIGNAFGKVGYQTHAYHNWEHNFYDRDKTMPTLGFPNYLACNSGMEELIDCSWDLNPPSDLDMMKKTVPKYIQEESFITYYISVSGHSPYNLTSKKRNYELVKDLPYSETVKGYLAAQIELDQAVEYLLEQLQEQGKLDDTVICLVGDHYPYVIEVDKLNELSEYQRDELFEIHHSEFIIWNNEEEKTTISKTGSQIDVLPTILNLFGLEYDSRLMIGHDLLSDAEGLAIFSDMSWISDSGTYVAKTKTFTPKKEVEQDYLTNMNKWINNSVIVSRRIITEDIYRKIMESIGE